MLTIIIPDSEVKALEDMIFIAYDDNAPSEVRELCRYLQAVVETYKWLAAHTSSKG